MIWPWQRRDAGHTIVRVSAAMVLAYVFTVFCAALATKTFGTSPDGARLFIAGQWWLSIAAGVHAVWHVLAYLGYVRDGARKFGYLTSSAFATVLLVPVAHTDHPIAAAMLGGAALCGVIAYLRYPRRGEHADAT